MKKKSFTLIEMLISITLFSIIIIFLYDTLEQSKNSNIFYSKKLDELKNISKIKKLFFEDIVNKKNNSKFSITPDKNKNSILHFQSKNSFHNPFYKYITYKIVDENTLVRIQSKTTFEGAFVDVVYENIIKFKVIENKDLKKKKSIVIYFEFENEKSYFISLVL